MYQADFNEQEVLQPLHQVFGNRCEIAGVKPFKHGARKQVFFIDLKQPHDRCVLYIWHDLNHYFSERESIDTTQSDANASALFKVNAAYMLRNGINFPSIYHTGQLASGYNFALVELIAGGNFTEFATDASPTARHMVLEQIGAMLRKLNHAQRDYSGTLLDATSQQSESCSEMALQRALLELDAASETHKNVAEHKTRIEQKLRELNTHLSQRTTYHLIHGELGPEHILIQKANKSAYFIDIDGLNFSDVEVEHALMKVRFSAPIYDKYFMRDDLDIARMAFYQFALHISFIYAGTRFMLKNYSNQEWAQGLFSSNLEKVLESL